MHIDYSGNPQAVRLLQPSARATLDKQQGRISSGIERSDELSLQALRLQRKAAEGCCNCGRQCGNK